MTDDPKAGGAWSSPDISPIVGGRVVGEELRDGAGNIITGPEDWTWAYLVVEGKDGVLYRVYRRKDTHRLGLRRFDL